MSPTTPSVANPTAGLVIRESRRQVPLEHVDVSARVTDLCARVTVTQRYRNTEDVPLEMVYVFPLDEGAAVCAFEAVVDGVRFVGEVKEREEAFADYDDAMEEGHGAFLLDEERADVFTASLGNVKPGSEVVLSISYVTELAAEGAAVRFTLPTTVSPRYAPAPDRAGIGRTPAEALNPPVTLDAPYGFCFEMEATMPGAVRSVTSPSHPIEVEHDGARARVRLARREAPMDCDLVIVLAADGLDVPHAVVELSERGGAALVSFVPKFEAARQPAEVVFVIDRSGSMGGPSIAEVRNALQLCLRSLGAGCAFNVVSFGSRYQPLFPSSRPYDEASMQEASELARTMDASMGGTELLPALRYVFGQPAVPGLARQVLVLTDGEVTNTDEVIALAKRHAASARCFTFGIGAGASQHLVRGIARASGGTAEFISPGERVEAKVMRQFARVLAPGFTDVTVDWGRTGLTAATNNVPPVFAGDRLLVYALGEASPGAVVLKGMLAGHPAEFAVTVDPSRAVAGETAATLAARARIRTLEEQPAYLASRGSRQGRERRSASSAEIVELGVRYQLCSRETSFVAIERRETPVAGRSELRRVPVALTSGWGGNGAALAPPTAAPAGAFDALPLASMALSVFQLFESAPDISECRVSRTPDRRSAGGPLPMLGNAWTMRPHDRLVELQAADGSWDLTREFARAIGKPLAELEEALAGATGDAKTARRALATALAVHWLDRYAGEWRHEWEMLAWKAVRWLEGCGAAAPGGGHWLALAERTIERD